jgi:hypothetical protein
MLRVTGVQSSRRLEREAGRNEIPTPARFCRSVLRQNRLAPNLAG